MSEKASVKTEAVTAPSEQAKMPVIGGEKQVAYYAPKIPGEKTQPDIIVNVNGKRYQIVRGAKVMIPASVYDVLYHAEKAAADADSYYYSNAKGE